MVLRRSRRMTEQLFGIDGVYNADLVARTAMAAASPSTRRAVAFCRGGGPIRVITELKLGDVVSEGRMDDSKSAMRGTSNPTS